MKDHAAKWIILGLLVVVVGFPFVLKPASHGAAAGSGAAGLIIYTPHNDSIRYEMARGFNDWRASQGLAPVDFDWRAGGTSDIRKQIFDQFGELVKEGKEDQGIGVDLFFGGGEYDHDKVAAGGKRDDGTPVSFAAPADIPDDLFNAAFQHTDIGGERLNHEEQRWTGVVLASFGIVYNRPYLRALGVDDPVYWEDLTNPKLYNAVALADPAHSGSITAAYHSLMRRTGWTEGWAQLRRIFANARYFTASSTQVPIDVSAGEAAAGMCIDYYGRFQAGSVGGDRVGYVDPPFMTAITADTLTILRGAPHMETAQQFVRWMITKEGQRIWQLKRGEPGGPDTYELRRQPIRADLFTREEKKNWTDPELDPFNSTRPMPKAMPAFFNSIAPISHALAIDIHDEIKAAWHAIITEDDSAKRAAMEAEFDKMPPELTLVWPEGVESDWFVAIEDESHPNHDIAAKTLSDFVDSVMTLISDSDTRDKRRLEWTLFFRGQYEKVVDMAD